MRPLAFKRSSGRPKRGKGGWVSGREAAAHAQRKRDQAASRAAGAPANLSPKAIAAAQDRWAGARAAKAAKRAARRKRAGQ